jgi:hypothetical protein
VTHQILDKFKYISVKKSANYDAKKSSKNKKWIVKRFSTSIMTDYDQDDQGNTEEQINRKSSTGYLLICSY